MSQRSSKLLLEVAEAVERKFSDSHLKLAGQADVRLAVHLIGEIMDWARGHRESLKQRKRR